MHTDDVVLPPDAAPALAPTVIAGFWRRLCAFIVDMLVLGVVGLILGFLFHEQFARLGAWGRAVGFLIALAYFGLQESAQGGGRSPGKRLLGLQVVSRTGALLGAPAALLRTGIFCLAYFLNGANLGMHPGAEWLMLVPATVTAILVFSVFYLLLFNRRTRQSLHDLAVGAYVVKTGPGVFTPPPLPVWRGHHAIVGAVVLVFAVGGVVLTQQQNIAALLATQQALTTLPELASPSVVAHVQITGSGRARHLLLGGIVDAALGDPEGLATRMAGIALATYPDAQAQQQIVVTLTSGYDIGIASSWRWTHYAHTPAQWRALAAQPAGQ